MPGRESAPRTGSARKSFSKGPRSHGRPGDGPRPKRKGFVRKKVNRFLTVYPQNTKAVDYKDVDRLSRFVTEKGKIIPRRTSGITAKQQRMLVRAIKRARHAGLLGFKIV